MRGTQFGLMKWRFGWRLTLVAVMILAIIGTMFTPTGIPGVTKAEPVSAHDDACHVGDTWAYVATYPGQPPSQWADTVTDMEERDGVQCYRSITDITPDNPQRVAAGVQTRLLDGGITWRSRSDLSTISRRNLANALVFGFWIDAFATVNDDNYAVVSGNTGAPLAVGNSWTYQEHIVTDIGIGSSDANVTAVVEGEETVTVDAGTFDCYRVVHTYSTGGTSTDWWSKNDDFLVPVMSINTANFAAAQTMELEYYTSGCGGPVTPTYDLTTASSTGGSVTDPGEDTYTHDEGDVVNLVAEADAGYTFVNWTGDTAGIANTNLASTTVTMNDDYSVTANFAEEAGEEYNLTTASGDNGSVTTPGEPGPFGPYSAGISVDLVATPDTGYMFDGWTGDTGTIANDSVASTSIIMNGDYSITANFTEIVQYELTTASGDNGSVTTPGEPGPFGPYNGGTSVDLVATPDSGYVFDGWTGDTGTIANDSVASTSIIMNGNYSITANFIEAPEAWNCPVDHVALIAPYANNGRAELPGTVQISDMSFSGEWFMVLELDEASGGWYTYYSGFTTGNTLEQLEPGKFYYVVVSEPGSLYY